MAGALRISVGADPECFLKDKSTGLFVSAHDKMPGTKLEPHKVELGAIQVDGVAAEFNIDPCYTPAEFSRNIGTVQEKLQGYVGESFELVAQPTVDFPEDYFRSLPELVRELGCNPDFNAWTGQVNDAPDGGSTTMRTGAGHIHIGWCSGVDPTDPVHFEDCRIVIKQLDYYLGMYSLMWDPDTRRRSLYGKAGSFRPKPYGVEYRPLSNVWLRSPKLQTWIFQAATKAVTDLIQRGVRLEDKFGDQAQKAIDTSEKWWVSKESEIPAYTGLTTPPPLPKHGVKRTIVDPEKARKVRLYRTTSGIWYKPPYSGNDCILPDTHPVHDVHVAELTQAALGNYLDIMTDIEI